MPNCCFWPPQQPPIGFSRLALAMAGLLLGFPVRSFANPSPEATSPETPEQVIATLPDHWQPATPEAEQRLWTLVLQNPLGVAALNQLAIEGFIDPTCDRTWYTHIDYSSFQSLLQVECPTQRGVNIAVGYAEMWVTFNRFEDNITAFDVERIYEDEVGLPAPVAEAVFQAVADSSGADPAELKIVDYEQQTWPDGCLGLAEPGEICTQALVDGWWVSVTNGQQTWIFRTNRDGTQVRLAPNP